MIVDVDMVDDCDTVNAIDRIQPSSTNTTLFSALSSITNQQSEQ